MLSPNDLVTEVAKLIAQGNLCYVERLSRQITSIALADKRLPEIKEQIKLREDNIGKYIKVVPPTTQELIIIMKDFLLEVTDPDIKKELGNGLNRKNPTRNFLQIVGSRPDINQHWILYKAEQYEEFVRQLFIKDYNY